MPFSGTVAIRAMKDNDYVATPFAGTNTGLQDAVDYVQGSGGKVHIGPGTLTISTGITVTGDSVCIEGSGRDTILEYTGSGTALLFATTGGVSKGHRLANLTVRAGANQTGGMVQFTGHDMFWSIENLTVVNPSSGYTVGTGLVLLNCQNGSVFNLTVRSDDATKLWTKGIDIDINDAVNRGNITFYGGLISNVTTGLAIAASGPGNAVNNCAFYSTKFVNFSGINPDGTTAVDINGQADETGFYSCHFERFENGIDNDLADSMSVVGCILSNIKNNANSAGDAIRVTSAEGAIITAPRITSSYNGVMIDGVSKGCVTVEGRWSVTGTDYSDTSTGNRGNVYINGATVASSGDPVGKSITAAANITLGRGPYHVIAGTTTISSITATTNDKGRIVTLKFSSANLTVSDGSNLVLDSTFITNVDSTLTLVCDGTNWIEIGRSYIGSASTGTLTGFSLGRVSNTARMYFPTDAITADRYFKFPDSSGIALTDTSTATVTNKILDTSNKIQVDGSATRTVFADSSGNSRIAPSVAAVTAERVVSWPNFAGRYALEGAFVTFGDADTTPTVAGGRLFKTANTGATSITTFDDGVAGQRMDIIFGDAFTTLVDGATLVLRTGGNYTPAATDTWTGVFDGSVWYELTRSDNT